QDRLESNKKESTEVRIINDGSFISLNIQKIMRECLCLCVCICLYSLPAIIATGNPTANMRITMFFQSPASENGAGGLCVSGNTKKCMNDQTKMPYKSPLMITFFLKKAAWG